MGAAAPQPILRNQWTTNFPGQSIKSAVFMDGPLGVGSLTANCAVVTDTNKNFISVAVSSITPALTNRVDFNAAGYQMLTITNDTTFQGTNAGSAKSVALKIFAGPTNYNLVFPSWVFIGVMPTTIASNKTAILSLTAFGTDPTNVVAAYAVQF